MSRFSPRSLFVSAVLGLLLTTVNVCADAQSDRMAFLLGLLLNHKADEKTKKTVTQFLETSKGKDVDELMKMLAVPWLSEEGRVLKDNKELRKLWTKKLDKGDASEVAMKVTAILPYPQARGIIKGEADRKVLDQVLGREDKVAFIGSEKLSALRYVLVGVRGEETKVVGGPYKLSYLFVPNKVPDADAEVLEKADQFELLSLDPDRPKEQPKSAFHGWKILGKTALKDEERKRIISSFKQGVEGVEGLAAPCFKPRHGIRVGRSGKTIDFVICFECFQVQVYEGDQRGKDLLIAGSPQPVFDKVLRDAGVPLAKKAAK